MGFYALTNLIKQPCALCGYYSKSSVCNSCAQKLIIKNKRCKNCATILKNEAKLNYCGSCLIHSTPFNQVYTLYDYADFTKNLIYNFKYNKQLSIGKFFAKKMFSFWQTMDKYDAIIPMPIHKKRLQKRGFNQVIELLKIIKRHTFLDYKSCKRIKATKQLTNLNLKEREKEVKGAFKIIKPMNYKTILLVDDVLTTSASISELCKTILKSYKKNKPKIDVLVLARTIKNGGHT